jgi:hypothetical protein
MEVSGQLYPWGKISLGIHWIRGRISPRGGLDTVEQSKSVCPWIDV